MASSEARQQAQAETMAELKEQMLKAGGASQGYTGVVP